MVRAEYLTSGTLLSRGDDMKPAFHEDATIYGYVGADLLAGHIKQFCGWAIVVIPVKQLLDVTGK